jgi:hypothetical protein
VEAEKIKTQCALIRCEGMSYAGFAGFEFQPHFSQPVGERLLTLSDGVEVIVEDHKVIRVSDDSRRIDTFEWPGGKSLDDQPLHPVQRHVRKQR